MPAHSYPLSSYIWGYIRTDYAGENDTGSSSNLITVSLHQLSVGSVGAEVKTLQRILYSYGCKGTDGKAIAVDGEFGSSTLHAVKALQRKLKIVADGVVGTSTWTALLTKLT